MVLIVSKVRYRASIIVSYSDGTYGVNDDDDEVCETGLTLVDAMVSVDESILADDEAEFDCFNENYDAELTDREIVANLQALLCSVDVMKRTMFSEMEVIFADVATMLIPEEDSREILRDRLLTMVYDNT